MTTRTKGKLAWHVHHNDLVEALIEPIEVRQDYIKKYKPEHERKTRLRLLGLVNGPLPTAVEEARATYKKAKAAYEKACASRLSRAAHAGAPYDKAWDAREKTCAAYVKAKDALKQALKKHATEIEALHQVECPNCPWDGRTIFPEEKEV